MADGDLKVFTSWSGDFARDITRVIRDWLPQMLDRVDPWMSDVDIQAGTRALQLIEERLNESEFGVIVVTTENQHSTWLNFEAGALSKRFEGRTARVVPVLVNFDNFYQIEGPIRQFQGIMLTEKPKPSQPDHDSAPDTERTVNKEGVRELLKAVSNVAGTKWPMVEARFEWSWSDFERRILEVIRHAGEQPPAPSVTTESLLKEILDRMSALEHDKTTASRDVLTKVERALWSTKTLQEFEHQKAISASRVAVQSIHNILDQYKIPSKDFHLIEEGVGSDRTFRAVIRVAAGDQIQFRSRAIRALEESGIKAEFVDVIVDEVAAQ
ncbi:TIR domain-containing protein [Prescottella equi]|uniref:TIR domain-containing protein n=1 Tax=Rhodococcus hoagii TaxID=43767 RepID=UPI00257830EE|nr:TIR domain-containing protein [Prescottella equi]WJJ10394.1 TIR domain-containing protein [Prescottella equi]